MNITDNFTTIYYTSFDLFQVFGLSSHLSLIIAIITIIGISLGVYFATKSALFMSLSILLISVFLAISHLIPTWIAFRRLSYRPNESQW